MKEIRKYEAFDGKVFDDETECLDYENQFPEIKNVREAVKTVMDYCNSHETSCNSCIFYNSYQEECGFIYRSMPDEWDGLI